MNAIIGLNSIAQDDAGISQAMLCLMRTLK